MLVVIFIGLKPNVIMLVVPLGLFSLFIHWVKTQCYYAGRHFHWVKTQCYYAGRPSGTGFLFLNIYYIFSKG
jgi:hypothetical protein